MRITHHMIEKPISLEKFYADNFATEANTNQKSTNEKITNEKLTDKKITDTFHHLLELGAIYINKKRVTNNIDLASGDYLRIHHQPRRFSISVDWKSSIIFQNQDFIVIDKPAGLPVHPTLDNRIENTQYQLENFLRTEHHNCPLLPCHRLDINTSGLLLFAKTKTMQKHLNNLFENAKITKIYQAHVSLADLKSALKLGLLESHMIMSKDSPKKMEDTPGPGKKLCQLKILNAETEGCLQNLKIQLLTGRTHQIRAQLSHIGHPILGDQLYGSTLDWHGLPSAEPVGEQNAKPIALRCIELAFDEFQFHCKELD